MATAQKGTEFAACVSKNIKMAMKCLSMLFYITLDSYMNFVTFYMWSLVEVECGEKASFNNTYFSPGSGFSTGNCAIEFCPDEDICQVHNNIYLFF